MTQTQATNLRQLIERAIKARQRWQAATPGTVTATKAETAVIKADSKLDQFITSITKGA